MCTMPVGQTGGEPASGGDPMTAVVGALALATGRAELRGAGSVAAEPSARAASGGRVGGALSRACGGATSGGWPAQPAAERKSHTKRLAKNRVDTSNATSTRTPT